MFNGILVISNEPEDRKLAMRIAHDLNLNVEQAVSRDDVRRILSAHPNLLTFWNADNQQSFQQIGEVIPKYVKPQRIFAITDKPLNHYFHLYRAPIFGHHLYRRFGGPAHDLYVHLARAALDDEFLGLSRYFTQKAAIKRIVIGQAEHKNAAAEAVQNFLTKQGLADRISSLVAQATDELIINATVLAPKLARTKSRGNSPQDPSLTPAPVQFELGVDSGYMGICVKDCHGVLKKLEVFQSLRKHYDRGETRVHDGTSLGIHGLLKGGVSLLLAVKNNIETDVMAFFPLVENYRTFKTSMRFLTVVEKSSV